MLEFALTSLGDSKNVQIRTRMAAFAFTIASKLSNGQQGVIMADQDDRKLCPPTEACCRDCPTVTAVGLTNTARADPSFAYAPQLQAIPPE